MRRKSKCFRIKSSETRLYHVLLALQCVYGCSDGVKNKDGEDEGNIPGGGERMDIALPLVCRELGFVKWFGRKTEDNGGMV